MFRPLVISAVALLLLVSCADSREVNSAFAQNRVSWFVFDTDQASGLRSLSGFEQAQKVVWHPRDRAVYATDLADAPGRPGAVAVSRLGLVLLDDADGKVTSERPGAKVPLTDYLTDRLFTWQGKLFLILAQETPTLAPVSLAWWAPGQTRLAFYPIPSQVNDPTRQVVAAQVPAEGSNVVSFTWKQKQEGGWAYEEASLDLANGTEGLPLAPSPPPPLGADLEAVRARLAERLGTGVAVQALRGPGTVAVFTESGWVSVAKAGEGRARLYRLPDLGAAGRYTKALALTKGFVFTWETSFRGYTGAAGLVHVPFGVLAP